MAFLNCENPPVLIDCVRLQVIFHFLQVQVHMYLTSDEISAILGLITSTCPPFSSAGVLFVKVALSVLLACPFLIRLIDCLCTYL